MTALSSGDRKETFIKGVVLATLAIRNQLSEIIPHTQAHTPATTLTHLNCGACCGVFIEPLCLPCGHSLCKPCAERLVRPGSGTSVIRCPTESCHKEHYWFVDKQGSRQRGITLVLSNLLKQWFPHKTEVHLLKEEGNQLAEEGKFELAIEKYSKAMTIGKAGDHRVLSNRSKALVAIGNYSEALKDAERCCVLRPFWAKGHYRRAVAHEKLGNLEESLTAFMLCMRFGGSECVIQKATAALFIQLLEQRLQQGDNGANNFSNNNNESNNTKSQTGYFQELKELIIKLCIQSHQSYTTALNDESQLYSSNKLSEADLECLLCKSLLFEPITASCGHTFCRECLYRVLDHAPTCPVCRTLLVEASRCYDSDLAINLAIEGVLEHHFKLHSDKRRAQNQQAKLEMQQIGLSAKVELPIFVCTHVYPLVINMFHVFEPRYRMLVRNCMEGSRRFGMCIQTEDGKVSNFGTVLYIESVQYTPDGRSLIKTRGERRFEIQNIRMHDGLHMACIEFITDIPIADAALFKKTENEVYQLAKQWFAALSNATKIYLINTIGSDILTVDPTTPLTQTDGPHWLWIFIHILPTSNERKTAYLKSTDVLERLKMLKASIPTPT